MTKAKKVESTATAAATTATASVPDWCPYVQAMASCSKLIALELLLLLDSCCFKLSSKTICSYGHGFGACQKNENKKKSQLLFRERERLVLQAKHIGFASPSADYQTSCYIALSKCMSFYLTSSAILHTTNLNRLILTSQILFFLSRAPSSKKWWRF